MVLFAAAAVALAAPQPNARPVSASVQATATIRVIAAVRIKLGEGANPGVPEPRTAVLRASDGSSQTAKLIEFQ
jgi:hypothetical protein